MKKLSFYLFVLLILVSSVSTFAFAANQSIYGRVWIGNYPAVGVKVAVYYDHWTKSGSLDQKKLIAQTIVSDKEGTANDGYYEIKGLPAGVKLMVVATHPVFPNDHAIRTFTLKSGQQIKINLTISLPSNTPPNQS